MDIPNDIKANPIKEECWKQTAAAIGIDDSKAPLVRMLCNWTDIAETALADIGNGKTGAQRITVEVPTQGGGVREQKAPAVDIYKDACNQILRLRTELGIDQGAETPPEKNTKGTTLNVIQCKFNEMQKSANSRRA